MVLSDEIVGMGESIYLNTFMNTVGPAPISFKGFSEDLVAQIVIIIGLRCQTCNHEPRHLYSLLITLQQSHKLSLSNIRSIWVQGLGLQTEGISANLHYLLPTPDPTVSQLCSLSGSETQHLLDWEIHRQGASLLILFLLLCHCLAQVDQPLV